MKNIYATIWLMFALTGVSPVWAQAQEVQAVSEPVISTEEADESDSSRGVTFDISFDEDDGVKADVQSIDQESIDQIGDLLEKFAGKDVAKEVVVELEGLSKEEKKELAKAIKQGFDFKREDIPGWVGAVAILGVILIFGFPILVLIAVFIYLGRKRRQKMAIIQVYLDAGKDVPVELLRTFDGNGNSFKSGIMLTGTGLGIAAAFNAAGDTTIGALGLIPLFIGVAKLLFWYFEERKYTQD